LEKREYARVRFNVEAAIISNGHFFRDKVLDLSQGGAKLKVAHNRLLGRDMLLKINLDHKMFTVYGDIRWMDNNDHYVGVQFLYLSDAMRKLIKCVNKNQNSEC